MGIRPRASTDGDAQTSSGVPRTRDRQARRGRFHERTLMAARRTIQIDADFPFSSQALRIRQACGAIGLFLFDASFRCAMQSAGQELIYPPDNDPWFCHLIGVPCVDLRNESGKSWTSRELWDLTGRLKLTRRQHDYGMVILAFPGFITKFVRPRRKAISSTVRRAVFERDGFQCVYCESTSNLEVDHVWPWSLGGADEMDNYQTLCRPCNTRKRDHIEGERAA